MDWTSLISDLRAAGLSQQEIAAAIGVSQPSISDLSTGKIKRPSYEVGDKLRALHKKRAGKRPTGPTPDSPLEAKAA